MSDAPAAEAGIGHNAGPTMILPTQEELRDYLAETYGPEVKRTNDLLDGVVRFHAATPNGIPDDEVMNRSSDFVAQLNRISKTLESMRAGEKVKFDQLAAIIQSFFKASLLDQLEKAKTAIGAKQRDYLIAKETREREEARRKQEELRRAEAEKARLAQEAIRREEAAAAERRKAEQAERDAKAQAERAERDAAAQAEWEAGREAREAAAAEAAVIEAQRQKEADEAIQKAQEAAQEAEANSRRANASTADLTRTRGDFGGVTSLRLTIKHRVTDITKLPADYLLANDQMIKAKGKGWKEGDDQPLAGVEFYAERNAGTRG